MLQTPQMVIASVLLSGWIALAGASPSQTQVQSQCYGSISSGRLEGGVELPASGTNFESYSAIARGMGRTYVHSTVHAIVLDAYAKLLDSLPDKRFKYAETGFEEGGEMYPHRTHQNGLSVDFHVPVIDESGESTYFPSTPFNRFGYDVEFDETGQYQNLKIDYEAMGAHIAALHQSALAEGVQIRKVIFDPQLQPFLFASSWGPYLQSHVTFSKKRVWVRHDEHYHIDFDIPCN